MSEILDSGNRREFSSGAVRDMSEGKGDMFSLPPAALLRVSRHYELGAKKYSRLNYMKGIPVSSFMDSALRHIMKYLDGWDDEDHLSAAAFNILGAIQMEERNPSMNDVESRKGKNSFPYSHDNKLEEVERIKHISKEQISEALNEGKLTEREEIELLKLLEAEAKDLPFANKTKRKLIYIAHPFQGKQENIQDVERIILELIKKYPDYTFYSPLHATGPFYFEKSYEEGMKDCIEILSRCDELWLCDGWFASKGCNIEYNWCRDNNKPIKFASDL